MLTVYGYSDYILSNRVASMSLNPVKSPLGRKLLLYLIAFSSFVTLIATTIILYSDYKKELGITESSLKQIETGYIPSLAQSLWNIDELQLKTQLEGVVNFPYVVYAEVSDDIGSQYSAGSLNKSSSIHSEGFELAFTQQVGGQENVIIAGRLQVFIDTDILYSAIYSKALVILLSQFGKTLVVSLFLLWLVSLLVTRHLNAIVVWAERANIEMPLILNRLSGTSDELDGVVNAINDLRNNILKHADERDRAYGELNELNASQERVIEQRTSELRMTIDRLDNSIQVLQDTQHQLVESEKMAQLGSLVAGVAHELNTPIGVCVTARSFIEDSLTELEREMGHGGVDNQSLLERISTLKEGLLLMESNLTRSRTIVGMFKGLAIDKKAEAKSSFNLSDEIEQLQVAAQEGLSSERQVAFYNSIPEEIHLTNYHISFDAVIASLISNSLDHGYPGNEPAKVYVTAQVKHERVVITIRDNGVGIPSDAHQKIFDPFYTTHRNSGKTGLGLHITYNLVTQILGGRIHSRPCDSGACFELTVPVDVSQHEREQQVSCPQPY